MLPSAVQRVALRKLVQPDAATALVDLRVPPGNRLERLKGKRAGQFSIRINDQWRICFRWRPERCVRGGDRRLSLGGKMSVKRLAPVHPGEILLKDFLEPLGLTQYRLAKSLTVPPRRVNEIVHGKRAVTADTALRLARFFGTSERFWLNLQTGYDLEIERDRLGDRLRKDVQVWKKAG
jgi:addiction module HigA family antidote